MADTGTDENMEEGSGIASTTNNNNASTSRPAGKEGSLKHRILSRPSGGAGGSGSGDDSRSGHSSNSTPVPSPSSCHSDRIMDTVPHHQYTPPKKRARISDRNSDSSSSNHATPHSELSKSTNSTPGSGSASRSAASTPSRSPNPQQAQSNPYQPNQFNRGSLIQLANGDLKAIESMSSQDFLQSAAASPNLKVEFSEIVRVDRHPAAGPQANPGIVIHFRVGSRSSEIAVEALEDHPFFVEGKGWSSTAPAATQSRYGLRVAQLVAGDTCVSLSYKEANPVTANSSSTALDSGGRLQQHNTPAPPTGMDPRAAFALSGLDPASFRRWSAPEDDRFLDNLRK